MKIKTRKESKQCNLKYVVETELAQVITSVSQDVDEIYPRINK